MLKLEAQPGEPVSLTWHQTWPPRAILFSDWLMLKKSSPLKLLGQMGPNLAGSIYIRSSIKFLHLIPFDQQTWLLFAI
jgi:hypothetical protein